MIYYAKATQAELLTGIDDPEFPGWQQTASRTVAAHYLSGSALITGPYSFGTPANEWYEVVCDPEVLPEIEARATLVLPAIAQLRASGPLRAIVAAEGRELIRNGFGDVVAPMPAIVIAGRYGGPEMLGVEIEDLDALPVLADLEQ